MKKHFLLFLCITVLVASLLLSVHAMPPPEFRIIKPKPYDQFIEENPVTIEIESHMAQKIDRVEYYYDDNIFIGKSDSEPFSFTWKHAVKGIHYLKAILYYENGSQALRPSDIPILVLSYDPAFKPAVIITDPPTMSYHAGQNVVVKAEAFDPDGSISGVEFFMDTQSVGFTKEIPFTVTINNIDNGEHIIVAMATDNDGNINYSPSILIRTGQSENPRISLFRPLQGKLFYKDVYIWLCVDSSKYEFGNFFVNEKFVGEGLLHYPYFWRATETGLYAFKVIVHDTVENMKYESPSKYVTVKEFNVNNKLPTPDFSYEIDAKRVIFHNTSYDRDGFVIETHWDFGDNSGSMDKNPVHIYKQSGTYKVILIVKDNEKFEFSMIKTIRIGD